MKKPVPVLVVALTSSVLWGAGSPAVVQPKSPPVVTGVSPTSILSLAKGSPTPITLYGSNFIYVSSAEMIRSDAPARVGATAFPRPVVGVKASLTGSRTPTTLGLFLEAPFNAPDGLYFLRLWAGGEAFDVPLERFKASVSWGRPLVLSCSPTKAAVGSVVTVLGRHFGDPAQPDRTQVLGWVRPAGQNAHQAPFELLSLTSTEANVRIPDWAVYGTWDVITPGGNVGLFTPVSFDPLYVRTFPPNLFQPDGTLGSVRFYESQFIFSDGIDNSVFLPSSAMRGLGFQDRYSFSFPAYEKPVNLVVGSTKYRVRLNGSNRSSGAESLRSTSLGMTVTGKEIIVDVEFESAGVEFVAEYETQDIISKKIYWKKFLNINIDNLALTAGLTPQFLNLRDVLVQSVAVTSSFTPGFVVLDQTISVDNSPIKDFIKTELEKSLSAYLLSDAFRTSFLRILSGQTQMIFRDCPWLNVIDVSAADDGGMKLTGSTRPVR